jgi:excisionase family DNA binding protein
MPEFEIKELANQINRLPYAFFTVAEVSDYLRISYCTVWRMVISGEVSAAKVGGQWRIPKVALVGYLQSRHPFNLSEKAEKAEEAEEFKKEEETEGGTARS